MAGFAAHPPLAAGSQVAPDSTEAAVSVRQRRAAAWTAWGLLVVTPVISIAWAGLGLARGSSVPGIDPFPIQNFEFAGAGLVIAGITALIALRRPGNRTWIALALMAVFGGLQGLLGEYAILALIRHPSVFPAGPAVAWLQTWTFVPFLTGATALVYIFPTGRPLSPRWALGLYVALLGAVLLALSAAFTPGYDPNGPGAPAPVNNPLGIVGAASFLATLRVAGNTCFLVAGAIALASVVQRFRRSRGDERQQLKLFLFVALFNVVAAIPVSTNGATPHTVAGWAQFIATTAILPFGLPISIGVAIMRYRLYDIDIVIRRTLVYGALAAFVTAVYVAIVAGIGGLVGSGGRANLPLSILATAVVAVAFQPFRQQMQRLANRTVYGRRASPYEVLAEISARAGESYAADEVLPRMARALAEGTGAQRAQVWVRSGALLHQGASWPESAPGEPLSLEQGDLPSNWDAAARSVAVRHEGVLLGALTVTQKPGETLTPVEGKLLDDLASQAGLVLRNFGLTAELRARLEDLRASRQRLVTAQDGERRRIERNLHDGAQQNLVALKVKVGLAELLADRDPARVKPLLAQVKADVDEALDALRDLARGIYPPLLADRGLVAALEAHGRKATVRVDVRHDGIGRYPAEVEAAIYFCCLEALQNVQKYAGAGGATVTLTGAVHGITFAVHDDGAGFDVAHAKRGSGLENMADRLAAMGGTLEVSSAPGKGTTIRGSLPVAPSSLLLEPSVRGGEADTRAPSGARTP